MLNQDRAGAYLKNKRKRVYVSADSFSSSSAVPRSTNYDSKLWAVSGVVDTRSSFTFPFVSFVHRIPLVCSYICTSFKSKVNIHKIINLEFLWNILTKLLGFSNYSIFIIIQETLTDVSLPVSLFLLIHWYSLLIVTVSYLLQLLFIFWEASLITNFFLKSSFVLVANLPHSELQTIL